MKIRNVRRFMNLIEYVRECAIVLTFGQMRMDYRNDFTFFIYSFCPQTVNFLPNLQCVNVMNNAAFMTPEFPPVMPK